MTKAELIGRMAATADISRDQAKAALEAFTDGVTEALSQGRDVKLIGFGSFVDRRQRLAQGAHLGTGEGMAQTFEQFGIGQRMAGGREFIAALTGEGR